MSIKKYRAFLTIIETGSITGAAKKLHHTQSGVTQLLNSLEQDLGVSLLLRNRSGITLTEAGNQLLPYIKEVIDADDRLLRATAELVDSSGHAIKIGAFTSVAVNWLPTILKDYQKVDAIARFEVIDCGYNEIDGFLKRREADFVFAPLPLPLQYKTIPLYEDPLLAVVPIDHPLAKKDTCPVSAFLSEPVISLLPQIDRDAREVFRQAGITPNTRYTVEDDYAMLAMVEKGLGICIMPELMLADANRSLVALLPLQPKASRSIGLAFPPGAERNERVDQFTEFVQNWIRKNLVGQKNSAE